MATQTLNTRIALKSDTTANWAKSTLVLLKGEQAIEITESGAYKIKIGDGVKTFAELPYATMTPEEISALIGDGSVQNVTLASGTNNGTLKLLHIQILLLMQLPHRVLLLQTQSVK